MHTSKREKTIKQTDFEKELITTCTGMDVSDIMNDCGQIELLKIASFLVFVNHI